MKTFWDCLNDEAALVAGMAAMALSPKEKSDLEILYRTPAGVRVNRAHNNVIVGQTIRSSQRIGRYLTTYFDGIRPDDLMMWIGYITKLEDGAEFWSLKHQIRNAIKNLQWFDDLRLAKEALAENESEFAFLQTELNQKIANSLRSTHEQRLARLKNAPVKPRKFRLEILAYDRNPDVIAEVLLRAKGHCELCAKPAPFFRLTDGSPYLEVHHKIQLSKGGDDTVENAIAVCPNCHRFKHHG